MSGNMIEKNAKMVLKKMQWLTLSTKLDEWHDKSIVLGGLVLSKFYGFSETIMFKNAAQKKNLGTSF